MGLDAMTFHDFIIKATNYYRQNQPDYRFGQAVFNYLAQVRPDISEQIRGTNLDPFHKTHVKDEVWTFIHKAW